MFQSSCMSVPYNPQQMGSPEILIFGESESTAKDHMSDVIANRSEP